MSTSDGMRETRRRRLAARGEVSSSKNRSKYGRGMIWQNASIFTKGSPAHHHRQEA